MKHHSSATVPLTWVPNLGTAAGGQFAWDGAPLKRYRGGPKASSGRSETYRRGQGQKLA